MFGLGGKGDTLERKAFTFGNGLLIYILGGGLEPSLYERETTERADS